MLPFSIRKGLRDEDLPWVCDRLESIPTGPGIYVFGRRHGSSFEPHYVGKATRLRRRIYQQLSHNVRLLRLFDNGKNGSREVIVCELQGKRGQQVAKALAVTETAVIRAALAAGHALLNVQGTRQLVHEIKFSGNQTGTTLSGKTVVVPV